MASHAVSQENGYMPGIPFNIVIGLALPPAGLTRSGISITSALTLLPPLRSHPARAANAPASFPAVTRNAMTARRPIAAAEDAARVPDHQGLDHVRTRHPSARGQGDEARVKKLQMP
ncbi:hypothetical protein [Puniceibacterium confluentis]|uniref:hypothetical protein n=1 Tax=Puniceibacterium confluentis TaxID=1958944 RepID=UPI0011B63E76|nr:hypothetical protein [Puniceibacterium confluentis]